MKWVLIVLLLLAVFMLNVGCASHPFAQEWEWKNRAGIDHTEETMKKQNAEMARIRRENPTWDSHISDDTVVIQCESSVNSTTCTGR